MRRRNEKHFPFRDESSHSEYESACFLRRLHNYCLRASGWPDLVHSFGESPSRDIHPALAGAPDRIIRPRSVFANDQTISIDSADRHHNIPFAFFFSCGFCINCIILGVASSRNSMGGFQNHLIDGCTGYYLSIAFTEKGMAI